MAERIEEVLLPHRGIKIESGRMWCTCGTLLWTAADGYITGPLVHAPGEAVGECAFRHHLAAALREAGIGDTALARRKALLEWADDAEHQLGPDDAGWVQVCVDDARQRAEEVGGGE